MSFNSGPPGTSPKQPEHLFTYFKEHPRETVVYFLLIIGIILLFFQPIIGGILIGLVTGFYFGKEIITYIMDWKISGDSEQFTKHLICIGVALAFFISAPAIFLGAAIAIGIKQLFMPGSNPETGAKP